MVAARLEEHVAWLMMGESDAFENPRFPVEPHQKVVEGKEGLAADVGSRRDEIIRRRDLLECLCRRPPRSLGSLHQGRYRHPGLYRSSARWGKGTLPDLPFLFGKGAGGMSRKGRRCSQHSPEKQVRRSQTSSPFLLPTAPPCSSFARQLRRALLAPNPSVQDRASDPDRGERMTYSISYVISDPSSNPSLTLSHPAVCI